MPVAADDEPVASDDVNPRCVPSAGEAEALEWSQRCSGAGWRYPSPDAPATVELCLASCEPVRADPAGELQAERGCAARAGLWMSRARSRPAARLRPNPGGRRCRSADALAEPWPRERALAGDARWHGAAFTAGDLKRSHGATGAQDSVLRGGRRCESRWGQWAESGSVRVPRAQNAAFRFDRIYAVRKASRMRARLGLWLTVCAALLCIASGCGGRTETDPDDGQEGPSPGVESGTSREGGASSQSGSWGGSSRTLEECQPGFPRSSAGGRSARWPDTS